MDDRCFLYAFEALFGGTLTIGQFFCAYSLEFGDENPNCNAIVKSDITNDHPKSLCLATLVKGDHIGSIRLVLIKEPLLLFELYVAHTQ